MRVLEGSVIGDPEKNPLPPPNPLQSWRSEVQSQSRWTEVMVSLQGLWEGIHFLAFPSR